MTPNSILSRGSVTNESSTASNLLYSVVMMKPTGGAAQGKRFRRRDSTGSQRSFANIHTYIRVMLYIAIECQ
jgi:hypothetical protein